MRPCLRPILMALVAVTACTFAPVAPDAATKAARAAEADSLQRHAASRLAGGTLEGRIAALAALERASLLDPGRAAIWLDFGRLCLETGRRSRGRDCYERALRASPDEPEAHAALGMAWTWEWLSSFDDAPLEQARRRLARAAELAPRRADVWSRLSALELARGRIDRAADAARRGIAAEPGSWEPVIALACAWYRAGTLDRADSAFRAARDVMPADLASRLDDAVWLRDSHEETLDARPAGSWTGSDPDLTTPQNEAALDYATRLGMALLLFRDARGVRWDMRTELFLRYGPPAMVEVNPVSGRLAYQHNRYMTEKPPDFVSYAPDAIPYPYNVQAWYYPELGFRAELWDRSLTQSFQLPVNLEDDADPRPHPARLASRSDLVSLGDGRGVYRAMPPGARPIGTQGHVARFPSDSGSVLVAHVATAGDPADTLQGAWALVGMDGRVIARGSGSLSSSSCDPTAQRIADFTAVAPPGDYRIDLSVSGSGRRRGLVRLGVTVPAPAPGLTLSDLVLLCGIEGASVSPGAVRIEPDLSRRVGGSRPLSVYFEIDRLALGSDGQARFAYTYSVVPVKEDEPARRRTRVAFQASREESHAGTRRRQFVTVPMRSIKGGPYELRIEVRDLVAGTRAEATARFERE